MSKSPSALTVCLLGLTAPAVGQTPSPEDCGCVSQFTALVTAVETNYVAYALNERRGGEGAYRARVAALSRRARSARPRECLDLMREYVHSFRDGHLFVSDYPFAALDTVARPPVRRRVSVDESAVRARLAGAGNRDPIEGVWFSPDGYRVAIVPDRAAGEDAFVAVMLTDTLESWRVGDVKAEFVAASDGTYRTTVYSDEHVPFHPALFTSAGTGASIARGTLLQMPPLTWGRVYPTPSEPIDPQHPRAPVVYPRLVTDAAADGAGVGDSTLAAVVVSLPSFSFGHGARLRELIDANDSLLSAAPLLVVDIRGNQGGSSIMPRPLLEYFGAESPSSDAGGGPGPVVLSSPANIRYFQRMTSQGWVPDSLIVRMERNPGRVVPFVDTDPTPATGTAPPAPPSPGAAPAPSRPVAVLIDGGVVSAGTAFVQIIERFGAVTTFGENTGGMIDYQNVRLHRFGCRAHGLFLGYPTLAVSDALPVGAINATGVPPDVRLDLSRGDPVGAVISYYRSRN